MHYTQAANLIGLDSERLKSCISTGLLTPWVFDPERVTRVELLQFCIAVGLSTKWVAR